MHTKIVAMTQGQEQLSAMRAALLDMAKTSLDRVVLLNLSFVYVLFSGIQEQDFSRIANDVLRGKNTDELNIFLYFLALFREVPAVRRGLNDPGTPEMLIERLILFTNIYFQNEDISRGVLRSIINGLDQERLLTVLLDSAVIKHDPELAFTVLMSFDNTRIDAFFARTAQENVKEIAMGFVSLPEYMIRDILVHNVVLFDSLRAILPLHVSADTLDEFNELFAYEIALTKKVNKYVELYRQLHDQSGDDISFRLALLVQIISRLGTDAPLFFERCVLRGVVIPEMEMLLARAAAENPTFSVVLARLKKKDIPGIERLDASEDQATMQLF